MENKNQILLKIIGLLIFLQLLLFSIKKFIFIFFNRTNFVDSISSMCAMIIITILFIIFTKNQNISLSIFPKEFNTFYIVSTIISSLLFILTPSNFQGQIQPILLLIYGSIITPIFEELIFRGYVWNKLNIVFDKECKVYIVTTVLFGLWHIGYISSISFRVHEGLITVIIWKVITGLCFGIILGGLRLKTKNTYLTILLHGVLNIFGK